jgi:hypothetical protein
MRLIYNLSSTSHARVAQHIEQRSESQMMRRMYTAGEKMKIVCAVDTTMMATENLPLKVAASRFGGGNSCFNSIPPNPNNVKSTHAVCLLHVHDYMATLKMLHLTSRKNGSMVSGLNILMIIDFLFLLASMEGANLYCYCANESKHPYLQPWVSIAFTQKILRFCSTHLKLSLTILALMALPQSLSSSSGGTWGRHLPHVVNCPGGTR